VAARGLRESARAPATERPHLTSADGSRSRRVRAAVCTAFGAPLAVQDVLLRDPGPGEVGVRVVACAICHSDLIFLRGGWGGDLPAVFGHEAAGVVDAVGPSVRGVSPGDHVVITLVRSCDRCPQCLRGLPALCTGGAELPIARDSPLRMPDGRPVTHGVRTAALAEAVTVHASQVVPIPRSVPLESAALLGCGVLTGVGAVLTTARAEVGSAVGVIGVGGVGLNAVQGAVLAGAGIVVAVDLVPAKLETALALGATHAVDAASDVEAAVAGLTGGRGLDHVVVAAGSARAVERAVTLAAPGGTVVVVGLSPGSTVALDLDGIADLGLRILGSKVGSARPHVDVPRLAELYLRGRLNLDELISGRFPLDRVNEAVAEAEGGHALRSVVVL
jgi:Zn-dependent alcohol dehydrogenase